MKTDLRNIPHISLIYTTYRATMETCIRHRKDGQSDCNGQSAYRKGGGRSVARLRRDGQAVVASKAHSWRQGGQVLAHQGKHPCRSQGTRNAPRTTPLTIGKLKVLPAAQKQSPIGLQSLGDCLNPCCFMLMISDAIGQRQGMKHTRHARKVAS